MQKNTIKKFTINFKKTLENLKATADKLRIAVPPKVEGGRPRYKEVIKQSVFDTAEKVYAIHMREHKKSSKPGTIDIKTKNLSLAKYCRNSERTIRRHIETLIKHGFIRAKARLGHGIQLLLNPAILVYDELVMAAHPPASPKAPTIAPEAPAFTDMGDLQQKFLSLFSTNNALART